MTHEDCQCLFIEKVKVLRWDFSLNSWLAAFYNWGNFFHQTQLQTVTLSATPTSSSFEFYVKCMSSLCHICQTDHSLHKKWQGLYHTIRSSTSLKSPIQKRFSSFQSNHGSQTYPPSPSWPISPGLSNWLSLLLIYYSNSPVSSCGVCCVLLRRDHLKINGSPEVTRGWGAKEMLGIQQTSWNQLDASEIVFNSEERIVNEHEHGLPRWSSDGVERWWCRRSSELTEDEENEDDSCLKV